MDYAHNPDADRRRERKARSIAGELLRRGYVGTLDGAPPPTWGGYAEEQRDVERRAGQRDGLPQLAARRASPDTWRLAWRMTAEVASPVEPPL